jgi:hypothetical protein
MDGVLGDELSFRRGVPCRRRTHRGDRAEPRRDSMLKTVLVSLLAASLSAAFVAPAFAAPGIKVAQAAAPKAAAPKQLTPQQQKMKDCAAKWQAEKAKSGVKGRAAYRKFLSGCLKAPA